MILSFNPNNSKMEGNTYFNRNVLHAVATISYKEDTPYNKVRNITVYPNAYDAVGRVDISVIGDGFINGHYLIAHLIVILESK